MKKLFILILVPAFILLFIVYTEAQPQTTPILENRIENTSKTDALYPIVVFLADRVDYNQLDQHFSGAKTNASDRARITVRKLMQKASSTQNEILEFLRQTQIQHPYKVQNIKSFWITNAITVEVSLDILNDLKRFHQIEWIDLDERKYVAPQPLHSNKMPWKGTGEPEPGIKVINAHRMWAMGYTGKNRKALGYDTGVNFLHPAIADRFLGNYMPLSHSYFSMYDFQYPVDISPSSHGTHTLGTVLGLDKNTRDTIGIAYNAYWMATDPIVSNEADIRPFHVYMEVFEWVLNPDGDTLTTHDIPDAVNNSWGLGPDHEYYECVPISSAVLDAVDAAGIANVFSAGNEGPGEETIGMPANIARSEVHVFSVGAIDGNGSAYTIASFSSWGPTPCYDGANMSIKIKPEVVAPGVNVRSAQGQNEYGQLSGTSMAAPHVTGAVLLLKEAFPQLPGNELLSALYQTAHDLGEDGEDNVYGNGIIDVYAAYEMLSDTYTPVPPASDDYDIAIASVDFPDFPYTNNAAVEPEITIINKGQYGVDLIYVSYFINDGEKQTYEWSGTLNSQVSSTTVTLPEIATVEGRNDLSISIELGIDVSESDYINNLAKYSFNKFPEVDFPYFETFENYSNKDLENIWAIVNDDYNITWRVDSTGGLEESLTSLSMKFHQYNSRSGEVDEILSPIISTGDDEELYLKFSYAYATRLSYLYKDSVMIYLSTDEGDTFPYLLFSEGGEGLATHQGDVTHEDFFPEEDADWKDTIIDLADYKDHESIVLKLVAKNDNGNNVFIDNIKIYGDTEPLQIAREAQPDISVYPNPASNRLLIDLFKVKGKKLDIKIYNVLGKLVYQESMVRNQRADIDITFLNSGFYIIHVSGKHVQFSKKFQKH